jgi:hypothetical protein
MSPEATPTSSLPEAALSPLPTDWQALRGCRLGGAPIPLVLMHPRHGVVLVGGPADGPALLRHRLEQARFPAVFHGHLPVIQLGSPECPAEPAFAAEPPLSVPGGDAWVAAVGRALTRDPPPPPPARLGIRARRRRNRGRLMLAGGVAALAFGVAALAIALLPPATGLRLAEAPPAVSWEAALEAAMPLPLAALPHELPARPSPPAAPPTIPWPALAAAPLLPFAIPPAPPGVPVPPLPAAAPAAPRIDDAMAAFAPPAGSATAYLLPAATPLPANAPMPRGRVHPAHAGMAAEPSAAVVRCRRIVQRLQIGETVPNGDFRFLQSGCLA